MDAVRPRASRLPITALLQCTSLYPAGRNIEFECHGRFGTDRRCPVIIRITTQATLRFSGGVAGAADQRYRLMSALGADHAISIEPAEFGRMVYYP